VTIAELAIVGALGVTGLGLVGVGVWSARRRRAEVRRRAEESRPARRVRVELEEDPIVAAMGIGDPPATRLRR